MIPTNPPPHIREILDRDLRDDRIDGELTRTIRGRVLAMGIPSTASFLMLTIYDLVDVFWLAKIGEAPVAAVTMFTAFFWVLSFANAVVGSGSVAIISRRFGQGNDLRTEVSIKNTFLAKLVVGTVFGAIGLPITGTALTFMGAEPAVRDLGVQYGQIQCLALGMALVSFSVYTAFRGIGRPVLGMWISVAGTVVNLGLDPVLIFGLGPFPELGIRGASIASALGFLTVTGWGCAALASAHSPVRVRWLGGPAPNLAEMGHMLRIGLPAGLSGLSFALFGAVLVKLVAIYGTTVVALFGMSGTVLKFGKMVLGGLGLGTSALVGQYLGSGRLHRAWLAAVIGMRLGAWAMIAFGIVVAILAERIVPVFFADPALVKPGALYLRVLVLGLPFVALAIGSENAYAGAGLNTPPMLMHLVSNWALTVPLMVLLGEGLSLGPAGMMLGSSIGQMVGAGIGVWLVRRGSWLQHSV